MPKSILIGEIEGIVSYLNDEPSVVVAGEDGYSEYLSTWVDNNLPAEGQFVRIVIMAFPDKNER